MIVPAVVVSDTCSKVPPYLLTSVDVPPIVTEKYDHILVHIQLKMD